MDYSNQSVRMINVNQAVVDHDLLAKSIKHGKKISLKAHLQDTAEAARLIFTQDERVGRNFLKAFKLSAGEANIFLLNLEIACLFHDIGKANAGFLSAIAGNKHAQVVRHEHLSALFMQLPAIRSWLNNNKNIQQPLILGAVLGHHLKARGIGDTGAIPEGCPFKGCALFFNDPQVIAILNQIKNTAQLGPPPEVSQYLYYSHSMEVWNNCINELERDSKKLTRLFEDTENIDAQSKRRFLAALKTALIISDSVASGIIREGDTIENWLKNNLHLQAITRDELFKKIIDPCTAKIQRRTGKPYKPEPFQVSVSKLGSKCLLQAGCGSGKTLAAYYWAAEQLVGGEFGRVIFLYPTRGTATEGFKDYTAWAPEEEAMLMHSQSQYALTSMLENPPDSATGKNYLKEANERLFALANFQRRFFSATVDQFLSFLQNSYSSMCMSVILADSVVILDEIHSYDRQMFAVALEFMRSMNVPTLCMTASIKQIRVDEIKASNVEVFPNSDNTTDLQAFVEAERRPRYRVELVQDSAQGLLHCRAALQSSKKVLWVVNTVDRCQQIANELRNLYKDQVICYHSRYKLVHREKQHSRCIEAFKPGTASSGIVAVTTQVCEMSLDLDADVLISELAPISSIIQRMGRVNRHTEHRPPSFVAPVFIYKPITKGDLAVKPYDKIELVDAAEPFINWLMHEIGEASQQDLAEGMQRFTGNEREIEPSSRLFDSGYFATPGPLREIDEYTTPSILSKDFEEAQKLLSAKEGLDKLLVPVPRHFLKEEHPSWLPKYFAVASSNQYNEEIGFFSNNIEVQ